MENGLIKKMTFGADMPENVSPRGKWAPGKSGDLSTTQLQRGTADALGALLGYSVDVRSGNRVDRLQFVLYSSPA